jgi:hypothetical protein
MTRNQAQYVNAWAKGKSLTRGSQYWVGRREASRNGQAGQEAQCRDECVNQAGTDHPANDHHWAHTEIDSISILLGTKNQEDTDRKRRLL